MAEEEDQHLITNEIELNEIRKIKKSTGPRYLHIYIEKTMSIDPGSDTSTLDPIFEISAFDGKEYTKVIKNVSKASQTYWGEHFFFEKNFKSKYEIQNSSIMIKCYDHNVIGTNSLIGQTNISQDSIYSSKQHSVLHKWFPLHNIEKNHQQLYGFVKMSLNVSLPGDLRVSLDDETSEQTSMGSISNMSDIVLPPQISMKKQQIIVSVIRGEKIVKMDKNLTSEGKADPYLSVKFGGMKLKTRVINQTLIPYWNEALLFPTFHPTVNDRMHLHLKDHDTLGKNETIGSYILDYKKICQNIYSHPFWVNFYGAWDFESSDNEMKEIQNSVGPMGTRFKGRVLMSISVEDDSNPKFKRVGMAKQPDNVPIQSFELWADIFYVNNINSTDRGKHTIVVNWGGKEVKTMQKVCKNGVILYFQRIKMTQDFSLRRFTELPDVIVSLYDLTTKKHISYKRFNPIKLFSVENPEQTIFMDPDTAVTPGLRFDQAGVMSIRLGICGAGGWNVEGKRNGWEIRPYVDRNSFQRCTIIAHIFQAKNLAVGDQDGLSDPKIKVYHFGTYSTTAVFENTLNPVWNQRIKLDTFIVQGKLPLIVLTALDRDRKVGGDIVEFLGGNFYTLNSENFSTNPEQIPEPTWIELKRDKNTVSGKLLASFSIFNNTTNVPIPEPFFHVRKVKHFFKLKILGLRNLQSRGIMPVTRPCVKINLASLNGVDASSAGSVMSDIITEPHESGSNPNIGTILTKELVLPSKIKLIPTLSCNVLDAIFGFSSKTVSLGNFEIDLAKFYLSYKAKIVRKLEKVRSIAQQKHNMVLLEKINGVILKFKDDIRSASQFLDLEECALPESFMFDSSIKEEAEDVPFTAEISMRVVAKQLNLDDLAGDLASIKESEGQSGNLGNPLSHGFAWTGPGAKVEKKVGGGQDFGMEFRPIFKMQGALLEKQQPDIQIDFSPLMKSLAFGDKQVENKPQVIADVTDLKEVDDILKETRKIDKSKIPEEAQDSDDSSNESVDIIDEEAQPLITFLAQTLAQKEKSKDIASQFAQIGSLDVTTVPLTEDDDSMDEINRTITLGDEVLPEQEMQMIRSLPKNTKKQDSKFFVLMPKYVEKKLHNGHFSKKEVAIPDSTQFIGLGYDTKDKKNKHYRYLLGKELEKSHYMGTKQFRSIPIYRGKEIKGRNSVFTKFMNIFGGEGDNVKKQVGSFKGTVDIISEEDLIELRKLDLKKHKIDIHIPTNLETWKKVTPLELDLMRKNKVKVRIYIIDAELFNSMDIGSENDPYLKIKLGDQIINDNSMPIDNNNLPKFMKMFEIKAVFPGCSSLQIQIWDHDSIGFDDLIGETVIDIENRFYDDRWRNLRHYPVETRKLYHPKSKMEKGILRMWVEIYSSQGVDQKKPLTRRSMELVKNYNRTWEIAPRPPEKFELRVIVWEVDGVPMADVEDTVDIYVSGKLSSFNLSHRTDVHYRSQTGFGSFNWRMKFPLTIDEYTKKDSLMFALQIWDKDIFKSNEFLSETTIDLSELVYDALKMESGNKMMGKNYSGNESDKFICQTRANVTRGDISKAGTILVSIQVVPKKDAEANQVGQGRSDPNQDPFLPNPTGRFEWTMNPWKLFTQMVGPKFRRKCCIYLCAIIYIVVLFLALPTILGNMVTGIF